MQIKSTLNVFSESSVPVLPGPAGRGQILKRVAGTPEHPSESLAVAVATFEPGVHEKLHWHLIEAFYYVISGRAVMKDIEGKTHDIGPGTVVYAPPGIAGSHSWDIKEKLQLLSIRATADLQKNIQFDVDPVTKESTMPVERLVARDALSFTRSMY
jgi:mannose-6-phosphate isomerase-like protein (cupin superfamily)